MFRFRTSLITLLALSAFIGFSMHASVRGELNRTLTVTQDEDSGGESPTPSPKPKKKATPKPEKSPSPAKKSSNSKKKKKKTATASDEDETPKPTAKKKASAESDEEATPKAKKKTADSDEEAASAKKKKSDADEEATPKSKSKKKTAKKEASSSKKKKAAKARSSPKKEDDEDAPKAVRANALPPETPAPQNAGTPARAAMVPTPPAAMPAASVNLGPSGVVDDSTQLTIEKSGYERKRGFWERLFGGGGSSGGGGGYRYLTASVRAAIDRAPADRRNPRWQFIVVHNSGTRQGNAAAFDYYHKRVRHMQNGLAYHFVIGNGTSTRDGQVEIGNRWVRQINGGHVHSDAMNNIALGICLVGDFNRDQPTKAQLACCEELIRYLRQRCGKVDNHFPIVKPHRDVNPPRWATDCPGDAFPYSWFRRF